MARLISSDIVYAGWSTLTKATIELDDGARMVREVEDHGHGASILLYDPQARSTLLVRQVRNGPLVAGVADPRLLETPAGIIDPGETAQEAVVREAMEEVGVRVREPRSLGLIWSCPGVSTESIALFMAEYAPADRIAAGGGLDEEHEGIEVVEMPLAELARMADAGELTDAKTLILTLRLRLDRPDLFTA